MQSPPLRSIDPVITFRNSQGDAARGTLTNLQRRSLNMEIYTPYTVVQISEVVSDLTIRSGTRVLYKGKASVISLVNTGLMVVVTLALTDEWQDLATVSLDKGSVGQEAKAFVADWRERFQVRRDFQVVVTEMRAYFAEVSRWVDQAEVANTLPRDASGKVREDVFYELAQPLLEEGRDYLTRFEAEAALIPEEHVSMHRGFAQAAIHPLILRSPFVYRTYAKPLGYAGDYEMVNQILGDPRDGPSIYFQLVNFMFLQAGVAQAHRNRVDILCERLNELAAEAVKAGRPMRVLNIGCGPAVEVQRFVATNPNFDQVEFVLVDFSRETLDYTRSKIEAAQGDSGKTLRLTMQHESVNQLLKRAQRAPANGTEEPFDYVYCAGLFDYLTDKVCNRLMEYFVSRSRPGARMLVTNVHKDNPEKNWMEHFLEWYLIYRHEDDMLRVAPKALTNMVTYRDTTGVNVFLEGRVGEAGASDAAGRGAC